MNHSNLNLIIVLSAILLSACSAVGDLPIMRATVHNKKTVETSDMGELVERVQSLRSRFGAEKVWVVFDIDNTVLTMNQLIGSDPWFSWQYDLLRAEKLDANRRVAKDLGHLLEIQRSLYSVSAMRLTDEKLPEMIRGLQTEGHPVMALTARNANMAEFTLRELTRFRISFAATKPSADSIMMQGRVSRSSREWQQKGFSESDLFNYKLANMTRPINYLNGVLHASGQHKGVLLRLMIENASVKPKAVVFVDDQKRHVSRVQKALAGYDISLFTYRYGAIDTEVSTFQKGRGKIMASREWGILRRACSQADSQRFSSMIRAVFNQVPVSTNPRLICKTAF